MKQVPDVVVVYKSQPFWAEQVCERLVAHGLDADIPDLPSPGVITRMVGSYNLIVVVPREQAERARELLAAWEREAVPRVAELQSGLVRHLLIAVGVPLGFFGIVWLSYGRIPGWLPGATAVLAIALVVLLGLRQRGAP